MISTITRRFTKRFQDVSVATLSSLRDRLESISTAACKFDIDKVSRDRVVVRAVVPGAKRHPAVVLPAYPTGHADDVPTNPNVVLDPLEFLNTESHADRDLFSPLLGHDVLVHFEKLHPSGAMPINRCC